MRLMQIGACSFSELNKKARESAIDSYLPYDLCNEENIEMLEEHGFLNATIAYQGFGSQGDGASFTADIDKDRFLVGEYGRLKDLSFKFQIACTNSRYCHERTKILEAVIYDEATDEETALITKLEYELESLRIQLCQDIYKNLEEQHDYQTSEEYIKEYLSDYEFDICGRKLPYFEAGV